MTVLKAGNAKPGDFARGSTVKFSMHTGYRWRIVLMDGQMIETYQDWHVNYGLDSPNESQGQFSGACWRIPVDGPQNRWDLEHSDAEHPEVCERCEIRHDD